MATWPHPATSTTGQSATRRGIGSWLDTHVYRLTADGPPGGWPATVSLVVVAAMIALLRLPTSQLDGMWAEDGSVFLEDALARPGVRTLTVPYNGYLHLWPRAAATVAAWVPLDEAALVFRVVAAAGVALAAWAAWTLTEGHLRSPWLRGGLALVTSAVPTAAFEAVGNVSNTHFWLLAATTWALLARRPRRRQQVAPSALVAITALSTPLAAALLPLSVGRLLGERPWRDRVTGLVHVATVMVQLGVILSTTRVGAPPADVADIGFGYALRVATTSVLGLDRTAAIVNETGRWAAWAVAALVVVSIAAMAALGRAVTPLVLLGLSLVLFTITSLFAIGHEYPPTGELSTVLFVSARYTIVPTLLLVTAWLVAAQRLMDRASPQVAVIVTVVALVPLLYTVLADYRAQPDVRAGSPAWTTEVEHGRRSCRATDDAETRLDIVPERWAVELSCDRLRR